MSCIRSSSHKSEAFQKDKKTASCLPWNNKSASLAFLYPNELRIHHTRNVAGNPEFPQDVVSLTSIIDTLVGVETYYIHYDSV